MGCFVPFLLPATLKVVCRCRRTRSVERWLSEFGHGYKWNTLPERGTFGVDQE